LNVIDVENGGAFELYRTAIPPNDVLEATLRAGCSLSTETDSAGKAGN